MSISRNVFRASFRMAIVALSWEHYGGPFRSLEEPVSGEGVEEKAVDEEESAVLFSLRT